MALVRDCMTSPAVTQPADAPVSTVISLLESRAISAVPIVASGRLVGIVSTTDLVGAARNGGAVADRMTSPVLTIGPDDTLEEAARRLVSARVHRLVVTQDDRVLGVLSARDALEEVRRRRVERPIAELMTRDVETIDIGDSVATAVERLVATKVHGLVVVDGTWPVGVFTHAEALAARSLPNELLSSPVEDVMSYETLCLDAATSVHRAAGYAVSMNVRRILVVEQRHLVGVLSIVDLLGVFARSD